MIFQIIFYSKIIDFSCGVLASFHSGTFRPWCEGWVMWISFSRCMFANKCFSFCSLLSMMIYGIGINAKWATIWRKSFLNQIVCDAGSRFIIKYLFPHLTAKQWKKCWLKFNFLYYIIKCIVLNTCVFINQLKMNDWKKLGWSSISDNTQCMERRSDANLI